MQDTAKQVIPTHATVDDAGVDRDEHQAVAALMADIGADAAREPARYLRETIVPEGGE